MMWRRLILIGVNFILVAGILWLALADIRVPVQLAPARREAVLEEPLPAPSRSVPAIPIQRPLFRPVGDAAIGAPSQVQPQAPRPELRLVGVLLGERRIAVVERAGSKAQQVAEGEEIAGWVVKAIDARVITLAIGERTAQYYLDPPRGG